MTNTTKSFVQLVGTVGKDVLLTTFENGNKKATLILAAFENQLDKDGAKVKKTVWYKIIAWGKMAEDISVMVKKGSLLKVTGKFFYRNNADTSGNAAYSTDIVMTDFLKLNKKPKASTDAMPF